MATIPTTWMYGPLTTYWHGYSLSAPGYIDSNVLRVRSAN